MERQYNEVTCDLCGKVKTTDIGKVPVDMTGEITISKNVFYENQTVKYENVCTTCINSLLNCIDNWRDDNAKLEGTKLGQ